MSSRVLSRRPFRIKRGPLSFWLVSFIILSSQLNYLIVSLVSAKDQQRHLSEGVSVEFVVGAVVFSLILVFYTDQVASRIFDRFPIALAFLIAFAACMSLSILYHGISLRYLVTLISFILYFLAAKVLAESYTPILASRFVRVCYLVTPLFFMLLFYFFYTGRIYFKPDLQGVRLFRPAIQGGMASTELAIFVGLQLIYLFHAFGTSRAKAGRASVLLLGCLLLLLLLLLFSVGALFAYGFVVFLFALFMVKNNRKVVVMLMSVVLISSLAFTLFFTERSLLLVDGAGIIVKEKLFNLSADGIRGRNYSLLWSLTMENPKFGIGWGNYVVNNNAGWADSPMTPHNNILGIAAENGVVPSCLYLMFVVTILAVGITTLRRMNATVASEIPPKSFLFVAVGCFVFLQVRGLLQDTWQIKEVYFWAGIIMGTASWSHKRNKSQIACVRRPSIIEHAKSASSEPAFCNVKK